MSEHPAKHLPTKHLPTKHLPAKHLPTKHLPTIGGTVNLSVMFVKPNPNRSKTLAAWKQQDFYVWKQQDV